MSPHPGGTAMALQQRCVHHQTLSTPRQHCTLRSRLCFWMAHGTICQVPAAVKRNAASVCVAALKQTQDAISAV